MTLKYNSLPRKTLSALITASATSFSLSDILDWNGDALSSANFGTVAYGVLHDAKNTRVEFFAFDPTTIADSAIDFTYRGLAHNGENLTTEVSANKKEWPKGTYVEIGTHAPQIYQWLKEYIDGVAIAGSPTATTSLKGIGKVSTAPVDPDAPIFVGDNDPRIVQVADAVATSSGAADAGKLVELNASGQIDQDFLEAKTDVQEFASSGTWTKPSWGHFAFVELWGGGGSGGIAKDNVSGIVSTGTGGGGGEYYSAIVPLSILDATETVTIGAGGAAQTRSTDGATNGASGGNTSFASLVSANGGSGGNSSVATTTLGGGAGGTGGSGAPIAGRTEAGASGGACNSGTTSAGGNATYSSAGGGSAQDSETWGNSSSAGGTSTYGANGGAGAFNGNGVAGSSKGGGGGGASSRNATTYSSGAGGNGYCRVTVF